MTPPNKGMKQTKPSSIGASQLIPGVLRTDRRKTDGARSMLLSMATMMGGVILGAFVGVVLGWLRVPPLPCSVAASLLGWALGSVLAAASWLLTPKQEGVLAVSVGLGEAAIAALAIGALAAILHAALGWASSVLNPAFAPHRGALLGAVGGLVGVAAFATSAGLVHPVR